MVTFMLDTAHPIWPLSEEDTMNFGSGWWWAYLAISAGLVMFAGIMSGLTLGLMSLSLMDLDVLQQSGTEKERKQAAVIKPLVSKQHQLLVTLLLCNAGAMEALPIFLDKMFHPVLAVVLSVTFVLFFGEIIPQAVCTRFGLSVGANMAWLVQVLMVVCFVVAYPIGKVLDALLGHHEVLFRRAQLKALVSIHGEEAGKGGELSRDETMIIRGALDLSQKTAEQAMTPIESTFSLDVNTKLDWEAIGKIITRGHSRIPVYKGNMQNIIGILLVKSLLTVRAEQETRVSAVAIRRIPRVPADMPLYDILNEFQKGSSHMAAVVKATTSDSKRNISQRHASETEASKPAQTLVTFDLEKGENYNCTAEEDETPSTGQTGFVNGSPTESSGLVPEDVDEIEVIGIITLEDVIEELLQEEIVDETDEYVDVHKRIRVAAAAAHLARKPSVRRGSSYRSSAGKPEKAAAGDDTSSRGKGVTFSMKREHSLSEPLLGCPG